MILSHRQPDDDEDDWPLITMLFYCWLVLVDAEERRLPYVMQRIARAAAATSSSASTPSDNDLIASLTVEALETLLGVPGATSHPQVFILDGDGNGTFAAWPPTAPP